MRKQFKDIDIYAGIKAENGQDWLKANDIKPTWKTPEHIEVRPVYTKEDLEGMEHLDYSAGAVGGELSWVYEKFARPQISERFV